MAIAHGIFIDIPVMNRNELGEGVPRVPRFFSGWDGRHVSWVTFDGILAITSLYPLVN